MNWLAELVRKPWVLGSGQLLGFCMMHKQRGDMGEHRVDGHEHPHGRVWVSGYGHGHGVSLFC